MTLIVRGTSTWLGIIGNRAALTPAGGLRYSLLNRYPYPLSGDVSGSVATEGGEVVNEIGIPLRVGVADVYRRAVGAAEAAS